MEVLYDLKTLRPRESGNVHLLWYQLLPVINPQNYQMFNIIKDVVVAQ